MHAAGCCRTQLCQAGVPESWHSIQRLPPEDTALRFTDRGLSGYVQRTLPASDAVMAQVAKGRPAADAGAIRCPVCGSGVGVQHHSAAAHGAAGGSAQRTCGSSPSNMSFAGESSHGRFSHFVTRIQP